jgi:hypothetical protein
LVEKLFKNWELDTWANVLELVGFGITIFSLIITVFVKSELTKLKLSYIFDNRIKQHTKLLKKSASKLNSFFDDYDNNRDSIKAEFNICISELEDLTTKLGFWQGLKCRYLIFRIKRRLARKFTTKSDDSNPLLEYLLKYPQRIYKTTYDDNWIIYCKLHGIIRQIENIKRNKEKSLSI